MKKIIFSLIALTTFGSAEFSRSGNIVTDSETGLVWEDQSSIEYTTWKSAIDYCENLSLDSYSDWRLPNINELRSIVDYGKNSPALSNVFKNVKNSYYWTSTVYHSNSSISWFVDFYYGNDNYYDQAHSDYVRCVR